MFTINEYINQDYANEKERALCEFIINLQSKLKSIEKDLNSTINEYIPCYYPVEYCINQIPFYIADSNIGEKTEKLLLELSTNNKNYDKERAAAYSLLDSNLYELSELLKSF